MFLGYTIAEMLLTWLEFKKFKFCISKDQEKCKIQSIGLMCAK